MAVEIEPRKPSFPLIIEVICPKCGDVSSWTAEAQEDIKGLHCQHCGAEVHHHLERA
jgi:transcription elongation factor Elf1